VRLDALSKATGCTVIRRSDREGTGSEQGGNRRIWLQASWADLIERKGRIVPPRGREQAKAIYMLLHERAHTRQEYGSYVWPDSEDAANREAARLFRWFCARRLGYSWIATTMLWRSLPAHYRNPGSVKEVTR
jgi:hypothetical protein